MPTTKQRTGLAHDLLTVGMTAVDVERIKFYERVLCCIFGKQFSWGSERCYSLRRTLRDMWEEAQGGNHAQND